MKNAVTDLEISAYQMSDEELDEIMDTIFFAKTDGIDLKSLSHEEMMKLTEFVETIPLTQDIINTLVSLGLRKLEELEEKNRRLYAERGWERYL